MMAGENKPRESLAALRRRARIWAGWEPAEAVRAEGQETDQSAREESEDSKDRKPVSR